MPAPPRHKYDIAAKPSFSVSHCFVLLQSPKARVKKPITLGTREGHNFAISKAIRDFHDYRDSTASWGGGRVFCHLQE